MAIWHKKVWVGIASVVDNTAILSLLQRWKNLHRKATGTPQAEEFYLDPADSGSAHLMVLQAVGDDFCCRHYGSAIRRYAETDMTGRMVTEFGGELGDFFLDCYREVIFKKQPLYAVHFADRARTMFTWERLILPLHDVKGNHWLVVYNSPIESRHQLLEAVINSTNDGILVVRQVPRTKSTVSDWLVLVANTPCCDMLGITTANPVGHMLNDIWSDQEYSDVCTHFEKVIHNSSVQRFEIETTRDGITSYFSAQAGPLESGCVLRLVDITERKLMENELRQNNHLMKAVLEGMPSGLSVFDQDLRLIAHNQKFQKMLDFPDTLFENSAVHFEDFIRHNALRGEYGDDNIDSTIRVIVDRARKTTPHQFERVRPNGLTLDIQGSPMAEGGFITTYTDVTARKKADAAVRASEERLQRALVASRLSLWDYEMENDKLYLSESWSEMLGGPKEATYTTFIALGDRIPLEDQPVVLQNMTAVLEGSKPSYAVEHRVIKLDGTHLWIRSEGNVVEWDSEGNPTRALGTNRDISTRKLAELVVQQTTSLLSAVLDAASEVFIIATDKNQVYTVFNQGAERLLGYTASEVIGQKVGMRFQDPKEFEQRGIEMSSNLGRTIKGAATLVDETVLGIEREWTYIRKNGSRFTMALTVTAMHAGSGEVIGYLEVGRDITAQKEYERSLKEATLAAEQLAHAKASFLATMSHEIRTPMNGVIGMTSLLLETPLSLEQREFTEVIRTSGESLMVVINDILDYSKIESGHMELDKHPFDLQECVEGSIDLLALKAQEKRLDLVYLIEPDVPRWILGDLPRLRQVLVNLISNALKFTETGEVLVSVKRKNASPDHSSIADSPLMLEISVQDTGIGIAPHEMPRLFKAFSQVDSSTSRKYGGTGLGLAISKRLVSAMGGDLDVESEAGLGTRFYFTMRTQAVQNVEPEPVVSPHNLLGKRVLLVDDNATNLRILGLQAQRWSMETKACLTPAEALAILNAGEVFDLLITDMHMPIMDGAEFAALVRRLWPAMPIVLLSSVNMRRSNDAALFDVVMTKPVRQSSLMDAFMRAIPSALLDEAATIPLVRKALGTQFDPELALRLPLRILLAEDNDVNQKLALRVLQGFGYRADVAANGLEVLTALKRQPYDLVLMDIQMPEMDGLEATRTIVRTQSDKQRPRIVGMSANAMREDIDAAMQAGMDGYVTKPITIPAIRAALEKWGAWLSKQSKTSDLIKLGTATHTNSAPAEDSLSGVLNLDQLDAVNEIDPSGDFLTELVASFKDNVNDLLTKLADAIHGNDRIEVSRLAHQIKGLSGNLGAVQLMHNCATLETQAKSGKLGGAASALHAIQQDYQRSLLAFAQFLSTIKAS